ncbi:Lipoprotein [Pseudomonas syringae pv. tagetis]|nr:Lipoprotein [Pseudomonas syringae pv. tagetis]
MAAILRHIQCLAHGEMSMLRRILFGLLAVSSLTLAGCAHSPQQLSPTPKLNAQLAAVGRGQPVVVRVVDGRPGPTLGTRGGMYPETSAISVNGADIVPKLQAQAEAAVRLLGFTPTQGGNAPQLTVTLADLKYQSPKEGLYVTEATISSTFRADVRNNGRSYSGRYAASLDQRFGMAPNQETNTKLVSDVLSDALTRVFQDATIGSTLAQ